MVKTINDDVLCSIFITYIDGFPPNCIKIKKKLEVYQVPGLSQSHMSCEFFYNDDGSFFGGDIYYYNSEDDEEVDTFEEIVGLNNNIPNLPIKVEYFATGEIDPTGFEI